MFALIPSARSAQRCCSLAVLLLAFAAQAYTQQESLGDYARKLRASHKAQVLVSREDAAQLFKSVDEITRFSSQDSGYAKLAPIARQLIGQHQAEKHLLMQGEEDAKQDRRMTESAVVLKKFGMLPADFDINAQLADITVTGLAGFYDPSDRTMYLLNWIEPEMQKIVMAHELTHALQDQNFHLQKFVAHDAGTAQQLRMDADGVDEAEALIAKRAIVEGQATVVEIDFGLQGIGISLTGSADDRQRVSTFLLGRSDSPVTIHNAPRLLREAMIFPYRDGLMFELELMSHSGRQAAFRDVFRHPPVNTHQILQPESYIKHERQPRVEIADLAPVFGKSYEAYDSGSIGELDVQVMCEDFGRDNDIYSVARQWDGGAYVAVKRAGLPANSDVKPADIALVYVSRWKTRRAAERFGQIYLQGVAKRLPLQSLTQQNCDREDDEERCEGPLWERHGENSEGPLDIELWPGNLLIVAQSVDQTRMQALRPLLLAPPSSRHASAAGPELAPRLLAMPQIQALSDRMGIEMGMQLRQLLTH